MLRIRLLATIFFLIFYGTTASADAFYGAALCKPPYAVEPAMALYETAQNLVKSDTSPFLSEVYMLPQEVGEDGFKSNEVVFAGTSIGVLINGLQADALAKQYSLEKETSTMMGASTNGYSRMLPSDQQPTPEIGTVSIVARESNSIPGKTLLACEFVSDEDQESLAAYESYFKSK